MANCRCADQELHRHCLWVHVRACWQGCGEAERWDSWDGGADGGARGACVRECTANIDSIHHASVQEMRRLGRRGRGCGEGGRWDSWHGGPDGRAEGARARECIAGIDSVLLAVCAGDGAAGMEGLTGVLRMLVLALTGALPVSTSSSLRVRRPRRFHSLMVRSSSTPFLPSPRRSVILAKRVPLSSKNASPSQTSSSPSFLAPTSGVAFEGDEGVVRSKMIRMPQQRPIVDVGSGPHRSTDPSQPSPPRFPVPWMFVVHRRIT